MTLVDGDLQVENLSKEFVSEAGRLAVLKGAGLRMQRGEALAVTGPSGSGKEHAARHFGTLERPTSGSVKLLGKTRLPAPTRNWPITAIRKSVSSSKTIISSPNATFWRTC